MLHRRLARIAVVGKPAGHPFGRRIVPKLKDAGFGESFEYLLVGRPGNHDVSTSRVVFLVFRVANHQALVWTVHHQACVKALDGIHQLAVCPPQLLFLSLALGDVLVGHDDAQGTFSVK